MAEQHTYQREAMNDRGIQWRLNPEETLREIENLLRGEKKVTRYKAATEEYIQDTKSIGDPLLNEKGINGVMRELRSRISKTTIQANTNKEELHSLMRIIHKHFAELCMANRHSWEISTIADYKQIVNILSHSTYFALSRTVDNKERELNAETTQVKEFIRDENKKTGWFG